MHEETGPVPADVWDSSISTALLAQVFDRVAIPTFVIDHQHVILHWNSALEALSGLKREVMIGSRDQWRAFYNSPRPCLADLIVDGGLDEDVRHYYSDKYRQSVLIPDAYEAEDFFPECGEQGAWLHFTAASLLDAEGRCIGAIETLNNINARKQYEFELIERERVYRELSILDALTGLNNSRHFHTCLDEAIEAAYRYQHGFSLCIIDLDNFKALNDNYGHLMGDRVLEAFGALIREGVRETGAAFRYGGEEFAILLPSTHHEGARELVLRISNRLGEQRFSTSNGDRLEVTASIGVTEYKEGDNAKTIFSRADMALYMAKRAGKNCARVQL